MSQKGASGGLLSGSGGAPDFDHPLEMLAACHGRIEDRCDLLHRLVEHLAANGCDGQARQAATSVLRYFDTAGEHHHEDEEQDLFPALVLAGEPAAVRLVEKLRADHVVMRAAWRRLRAPLEQLASGEGVSLDAGDVEAFTTLYREHIAREDAELLPLAQRVLDDEGLRTIGAAMAQRRGVRV